MTPPGSGVRPYPTVTNNRAMELSFRGHPRGVTSNPMGQFLQTQIDSKAGRAVQPLDPVETHTA
jgi:hypothetical protein